MTPIQFLSIFGLFLILGILLFAFFVIVIFIFGISKKLERFRDELAILKKKFEKICKDDTYLIYSEKTQLLTDIDALAKKHFLLFKVGKILESIGQTSISHEFKKIVELKGKVNTYNQVFVRQRKAKYAHLFTRDGIKLDDEQQTAIITDDKHNLVVAGAGSGKTEVLTTRIAYLVKRSPDTIYPNRILALAFQNKAAGEISERLKHRYKINVKVKTFHALGKEVLETASKIKGVAPPHLKFSGDNFERENINFIKKIFKELQTDGEFQERILDYMKYYGDENIEQTETDFKTKEDHYKYMRELRYTALNGVKVKSEAERDILNFFITHNFKGKRVNIEYESPAEWMDDGSGIYPKPDFFFPDFDLYLEHWALDKNGKVPEWFDGDNPTSDYKKMMKYKQEKFKLQKKYTLIETFTWEHREKNFLTQIQKRFLKAISEKDNFTPVPYDELVERIWNECKGSVKALDKNISRFIVIAKTYDLSPAKISQRLKTWRWSKRQISFAKLALPVYEKYDKILRDENAMDFEDMINLAIRELHENSVLYLGSLDHILIDEYQDISTQRYHLIRALLDKNQNCKLFCVGDDWQSIMSFSGSNLDYFINFDHYFDHPARTDLIKNYRSIRSIVDTGAHIIKHNEDRQLQKKTEAVDSRIKKVKVYLHLHKEEYRENYYYQMTQHCIDQIEAYLKNGYKPEEIMILTRILNSPSVRDKLIAYAKLKHIPLALDNDREGIRFMSVHKSKGLQAKVVFILNVVKDLYGFPCELESPDLFEPAIIGDKRDKTEEERRLFYVAVTRAKEDVHIYTQKCAESDFLKEIKGISESIEVGY